MKPNNVIKQDLSAPKGKQKKISAEPSLSKDMPKQKNAAKKSTPSTKMDGEDFLADSPSGNRKPKAAKNIKQSNKNLDAEQYLSDSKFMRSFTKMKSAGSSSLSKPTFML